MRTQENNDNEQRARAYDQSNWLIPSTNCGPAVAATAVDCPIKRRKTADLVCALMAQELLLVAHNATLWRSVLRVFGMAFYTQVIHH
jgi:hypothetical protein